MTAVAPLLVLLIVSQTVFTNELINTIKPLHYDLTILPYFHNLTFVAEVNIKINVEFTSDYITLHVQTLSDLKIKILDLQENEIVITGVTEDDDTITINFANPLVSGLYEMQFSYSGKINEKQEGLYVSTNGITGRPFLLTNFQYGKARQVFPCFDHPAFPATFSINIIREKNYISVSNMAKKGETLREELIVDEFAQSDMMSTHMVSFAIIDFEKIVDGTSSVYSIRKEKTDLMIDLSAKIAEKLTQLYPIKLNKIDQIIVPDSSLPTNSLENIGLIIYRESAVLYNEITESAKEKQSIFNVIARAFSRQLDNSESSTDWQNFWLKEGLLIFYQYEISTILQPDWKLLQQFIVKDMYDTLANDVGDNSFSLLLDENNFYNEIENLPTGYSAKAFAMINMFMHSKLSTDSEGYSWIKYRSYPTLRADYNQETMKLILTQNKSQQWPIPFSINEEYNEISDNELNYNQILNTANEEIISNFIGWYTINKLQTGYYRIDYDKNNWKLLSLELQRSPEKKMSALSRAQLIDDAFFLAKIKSSYAIYLELIKFIQSDTDYIPLYTFIKTTTQLKNLLAHTETQAKFINYTRNLAEHLYEKMGSDIKTLESDLDRMNRVQILNWLCHFGHVKCKEEMYSVLLKNESVHSDLQEIVYCGGMHLGNLENFMFLIKQLKVSPKAHIFKALGCTSNLEILHSYFLGIIDESTIITIDPLYKLTAFHAIIEGSENGIQVALNGVKQYLDKVLTIFSFDEINEIFMALSKKILTTEQQLRIDEIIECLSDAEKITYAQLFEEVKKNIRTNLEWRNSFLEEIDGWLNKENDEETTTIYTTPTNENNTKSVPITTTPVIVTTSKSKGILITNSLIVFIITSLMSYVL